VTDVKWNYEVNKRITPFTPAKDADFTYYQEDVDRVQEFRKCIECFLCQNVCHILRNHEAHDRFAGPRFFVRVAGLEMHPMDTADRTDFLAQEAGVFLCNITKCCTHVCPEDIHITDSHHPAQGTRHRPQVRPRAVARAQGDGEEVRRCPDFAKLPTANSARS
jgi:succinate dehydrogenase / fumarate reductase iron-sulfur subunit